jgi:hypothetical protein
MEVLRAAQQAAANSSSGLHSNVVDPFSALFDATRQGIGLSQWFEQEKSRQAQKTMQNALGTFHQNIMGSIDGWENLGTGNVVDLRNTSQKIVAEVKNKFNTTKGSDKIRIYDLLTSVLQNGHEDFTGYYVEIIPPGRRRYNTPFTPSDNVAHARRTENTRIRVIDGYSFYDLASGHEDALRKLYAALPRVIHDLLGRPIETFVDDPEFINLFNRAY